MTEEKTIVDWKALAFEQAEAFKLPVEDLKKEVQRELTARVAKGIVDAVFHDMGDNWVVVP